MPSKVWHEITSSPKLQWMHRWKQGPGAKLSTSHTFSPRYLTPLSYCDSILRNVGFGAILISTGLRWGISHSKPWNPGKQTADCDRNIEYLFSTTRKRCCRYHLQLFPMFTFKYRISSIYLMQCILLMRLCDLFKSVAVLFGIYCEDVKMVFLSSSIC